MYIERRNGYAIWLHMCVWWNLFYFTYDFCLNNRVTLKWHIFILYFRITLEICNLYMKFEKKTVYLFISELNFY